MTMKLEYSGVVANTDIANILGNDFCGNLMKENKKASCTDEMIGSGKNSLQKEFQDECDKQNKCSLNLNKLVNRGRGGSGKCFNTKNLIYIQYTC